MLTSCGPLPPVVFIPLPPVSPLPPQSSLSPPPTKPSPLQPDFDRRQLIPGNAALAGLQQQPQQQQLGGPHSRSGLPFDPRTSGAAYGGAAGREGGYPPGPIGPRPPFPSQAAAAAAAGEALAVTALAVTALLFGPLLQQLKHSSSSCAMGPMLGCAGVCMFTCRGMLYVPPCMTDSWLQQQFRTEGSLAVRCLKYSFEPPIPSSPCRLLPSIWLRYWWPRHGRSPHWWLSRKRSTWRRESRASGGPHASWHDLPLVIWLSGRLPLPLSLAVCNHPNIAAAVGGAGSACRQHWPGLCR